MIRTRMAMLTRGLLAPALILGLLIQAAPPASPAYAAVNCTVAAGEELPDQQEAALLSRINAKRPAANAYTWSNSLGRAAIWMAHDVANHNRNDWANHTDSLGRGLSARLADCGQS